MSFVNVLPYFRTAMNELDFNEWTDAFAVNNIPDSIIDLSYHLQMGLVSSGPSNQLHHVFTVPVDMKVFFKGFQDTGLARVNVYKNVDLILEGVLSAAERVGRTDGIKDVRPINISIDPVDGSNDNDFVVTFSFEVILICYFS